MCQDTRYTVVSTAQNVFSDIPKPPHRIPPHETAQAPQNMFWDITDTAESVAQCACMY